MSRWRFLLSTSAEQEAGAAIHAQRSWWHRHWWAFVSVNDHGYCFECVRFGVDAIRAVFDPGHTDSTARTSHAHNDDA